MLREREDGTMLRLVPQQAVERLALPLVVGLTAQTQVRDRASWHARWGAPLPFGEAYGPASLGDQFFDLRLIPRLVTELEGERRFRREGVEEMRETFVVALAEKGELIQDASKSGAEGQ